MADHSQSGGNQFSWQRVTAFSSAFALHAFAFAMIMAPVAPPPSKDKTVDKKVMVEFIEPPPPPPP
ncbi:MAG: energy transducer TonB, partial [Dokdonella sp.]|nr:energy transducer TonB [Dokdonella sp.]